MTRRSEIGASLTLTWPEADRGRERNDSSFVRAWEHFPTRHQLAVASYSDYEDLYDPAPCRSPNLRSPSYRPARSATTHEAEVTRSISDRPRHPDMHFVSHVMHANEPARLSLYITFDREDQKSSESKASLLKQTTAAEQQSSTSSTIAFSRKLNTILLVLDVVFLLGNLLLIPIITGVFWIGEKIFGPSRGGGGHMAALSLILPFSIIPFAEWLCSAISSAVLVVSFIRIGLATPRDTVGNVVSSRWVVTQ
ncbi:hypothetical protein AAVH_14794, partial [Aphelenchoides avenae]